MLIGYVKISIKYDLYREYLIEQKKDIDVIIKL